ncbi:S-adenosyl-L-methionine-dependent methyltransferase [Hysterangium stoloniferum]|nr:S-adenosyl-L-methionine-dependent methyltransferase [Hysterangium stoloniferum]
MLYLNRITARASGPLPVSQYMQLCLSHPIEGYYMKQHTGDADVFGSKGDFTTSPEISQVFGELLCLWFLSIWRSPQGNIQYPKIRYVELGPGRGTLMSDFIRTLSMWPEPMEAFTSIHLVETSQTMRSRQGQALQTVLSNKRLDEGRNITPVWYDSIDDVPEAAEDEFTIVVANEFFDALPINILEERGFREIMVDTLSPTPAATLKSEPSFRFVVSREATPRSELLSRLSPRFSKLPNGSRIEIASSAWRIGRKLAELISSRGESMGGETRPFAPKGAALIIDYGDEHAFGSSFRAFKSHRLVDVFEDPGMCDLTANVDFALLKESMADIGISDNTATTHGSLMQSDFLTQMGLFLRLQTLMERQRDYTKRREIETAGYRLVNSADPRGMGKVFRVLGVTGGVEHDIAPWPFQKAIGSC